jgi:hypothetical protein
MQVCGTEIFCEVYTKGNDLFTHCFKTDLENGVH